MVYLLSGVRTGFIVDSVAEVLRIPRSQISAAPEMSDEQSRLISRVAKLNGDKRLVMLIEPQHLLHGQEMNDLTHHVHGTGEPSVGAAPGQVAGMARAA